MSATIHPQPVKLQENVTLVFTNVQVAYPFVGQFSIFFLLRERLQVRQLSKDGHRLSRKDFTLRH